MRNSYIDPASMGREPEQQTGKRSRSWHSVIFSSVPSFAMMFHMCVAPQLMAPVHERRAAEKAAVLAQRATDRCLPADSGLRADFYESTQKAITSAMPNSTMASQLWPYSDDVVDALEHLELNGVTVIDANSDTEEAIGWSPGRLGGYRMNPSLVFYGGKHRVLAGSLSKNSLGAFMDAGGVHEGITAMTIGPDWNTYAQKLPAGTREFTPIWNPERTLTISEPPCQGAAATTTAPSPSV